MVVGFVFRYRSRIYLPVTCGLAGRLEPFVRGIGSVSLNSISMGSSGVILLSGVFRGLVRGCPRRATPLLQGL